jgi:hypothetical protein
MARRPRCWHDVLEAPLFDSPGFLINAAHLLAPLGLNQLILAVWLIERGFRDNRNFVCARE